MRKTKTRCTMGDIAPLALDVVLRDEHHAGIHIRQIDGKRQRITIGQDGGHCAMFFRGDAREAAELLERCAGALRELP